MIDRYIHFYNHDRIQLKTGEAPLGRRLPEMVLKKRGIYRNPKTILRIMEKYGLLADIRRRRKWVNMGQQVHKYENLLNRQFHPDRPNSKWVTDISYFHTKQGVLYLSMIRDLYDNCIVVYKTDTKQTVNLVLDTIRLAMRKEKKRGAAEMQLHSDQGFQYTLYYRVVVFSVPLQGHMLHCLGCVDWSVSPTAKTVHVRLQPQPFAGLLIS